MNLRAFFVLFYVVNFIIVTTPERKRLRKLAETDPAESSRIAHLQVKKAFRNMLRIAGVKIEVSGLDNIPDESCLYVGNHNSYVDILVSEVVIPTGAGFVSKDSLQKIPGLSSWMYLIHCLFLNRTDVREGLKMITTGAEYLKEGYSMFIFPEGTRNKSDSDLPLLPFHEGSFRMALKSKCPIVPVAICNTVNVWEAHFPWIRSAHVILEYGDPIYTEELEPSLKKRVGAYVREKTEEMIEKNQKLL